MSFEFTQDDLRSGNRQMMDKLVAHVNTLGGEARDFSKIEELDLESKLTIKDVAEAYNKLVKALQE